MFLDLDHCTKIGKVVVYTTLGRFSTAITGLHTDI